MIPSVGVIGFGNMGEALALGLARKNLAPSVGVYETFPAARAKAQKNKRLTVHDSLESLVEASSIVVIAIKPQDIPALVARLRPLAHGRAFISLAAGLGSGYFQKELGVDQVVRFMPNLAAKVGKSLVGVSPGAGCGPAFADQALAIAGAVGRAVALPEKLMAAITGLSGSGIAFVFHFVHALAMGGVREGFAYPQALEHVLDTIDGAVALLRDTGDHPIAFESKVCSPSGTTIEGVKALEAGGFTDAVLNAVSAAARRAHELER
jgi:pyrroline-5-carboxylate reductase